MDASSSRLQWKYDVFLSFRGEDTRNSFVAQLYHAMCRRGINTFLDDHNLRGGQVISPALATAIQNSMFSIVVLSKEYASSGWCLEELVKILESKTGKEERVIPIFYNVDPSDIRNQKGEFGKAFNRLVKNLKGQQMQRVKIWRKALTQVANIAGEDSRNRHEPSLIKKIIAGISNKVFSTYSTYGNNLAGIHSRIKEVESLLCVAPFDVGIIGICGIHGIGKTTLAHAVYRKICHQFECSAFLENVDEDYRKQGLIGLQNKLFSLLLDDGNLNIKGCTSIERRLCWTKVLTVLDNVKDGAILEFLTANKNSFGPGSRIILTTTEKDLFISYSVKYYEVRLLTKDESMDALRHYSSKHKIPEDDSMELSVRIRDYAQGLPLALKVLGSSLFHMEKPEWRSHLDKLKSCPHPKINQVLQISYDELDHKAKNIFLDIACFFRGEDKDHVMEIFEACGFFPVCGIRTLLDKSLLTIYNNKLEMHDLIRDMGMEVVRQKFPDEPGKWSRLWLLEDVSRVLKKKSGTEEVEGIFFNLSNLQEINFTSEGFARMNNLRLLKVHTSHISRGSECPLERKVCQVHFSRNFKFHSEDLRYLYWHGYSLESLPSEFNPENLVELNMPYSHITQLWKGAKDLEKLKSMELSHSQFLVKTPDLSRATNLERLVLEGCTHLHAVDPSLADLKKLIFLSLKDCINLRDFPSSIELESLHILILSGCSKLRKFPEIRGYMKYLSELLLNGAAIDELPSSIEHATGLILLDLTNCKELKGLPNSICNLGSLQALLLSDCSKLESLPQNFGKLKGLRKLHANRTPLRGLPDSFVDLRFTLQEVSFAGCKGSPNSASWLLPWKRSYSIDLLLPPLSVLGFLKDLNLSDCNIMDGMQLNNLSLLSSLKKLNLSGNHFVWLPSSFSRLPQLTLLKLLNCRSLQELPKLPSSIEVINAHNCRSLGKIPSQPLCKWIRHSIFTNCFKLKDYQRSIKSIFQTVVANVQLQSRFKYPQDHGRHFAFRTLIPGNGVPEWFSHQNKESNRIYVHPSPNWNNNNFLGFALCVVLGLKDVIHQEIYYLSCTINNVYIPSEILPRMFDFIPLYSGDGLINSDHIWLAYAPASSCKDWDNGPSSIVIAFYIFGNPKIINSCGVRLVYTEDVSDDNATMIKYISAPQPSSIILEEIEHSVDEDSEVNRSLNSGESNGSGLEFENDHNYDAREEDHSGNGHGWFREHIQSETPTGWYSAESAFQKDLEESVSEDSISWRSLDEGEPSGNDCSDNGSKKQKRER